MMLWAVWDGSPLNFIEKYLRNVVLERSMMHRKMMVCWMLFLTLSCAATCWGEEYEYIDISNPFLRKIPLAIPVFKTTLDTPAEQQFSAEASDLLSRSLDFTGYFKIIDRTSFLEDTLSSGITTANVNFSSWTGIGAEMLLTGGVSIHDNLLEVELRLIDTFKQELLVGKRYKGWIDDQRKIIHRFCSEVIFRLTGGWGMFNSKIAFVSNGTENKEIYLCDFDGYNSRMLTHHNTITLFPDWSSDAQWIAYTSYAKGKPDLYIKHIKDKRGAVVSKKGINTTPAWVPGRFALAATLSFTGDPEIYLLTGTGKIIKRITSRWGIDESPTWSPDGKKMAFVSDRSGSPQIYIDDLEANEVVRLTFEGKYNTQPAWSPKGDKIAYSALQNGQNNIYVVGVDGEGLIQLTQDQGDNESPSWSPDGNLIVFSSTREGPSRIYVMTAYGTDQRRLLTLPGEQTSPAWSPRISNN
jgi:TolB protein